jgi:hypothetical protein
MSYQRYFHTFWAQYLEEIPLAKEIYQLLQSKGEHFTCLDHDHMALRTFNDPRVKLDVMMKPFVDAGYTPSTTYEFPLKRLFARHYEPPIPGAPKIFISHLLIERFSPEFQKAVHGFLNKIPEGLLHNPAELLTSKTSWGTLDYDTYHLLLKESQYAAWLYAYGYRANHFAVKVNALKHFKSCQEIDAFLKSKNYTMNMENGEIKGSAAELLEQSSIMAKDNDVVFSDGIHSVPSCYYEFTRRYPDKNGVLYPGFIAASADKIFQSTDVVSDADSRDLELGQHHDKGK